MDASARMRGKGVAAFFAGRDAFLARGLWPRIQRADRSAEHGAIHYLDSAANAFSSCARPLATGPMQERIDGLS